MRAYWACWTMCIFLSSLLSLLLTVCLWGIRKELERNSSICRLFMETKCQLFCICVVVGFTAVMADILQPLVDEKLFKCIIDNVGHAIISAAIWNSSFSVPFGHLMSMTNYRLMNDKGFRTKYLELFFAFCVGSLMDTDHFIAAGWSTSLRAATSLPSRPFAHSVTFIFVIVVSMLLLSRNYRIGLLVAVSLLSHQIRDATRRGLWFYPLGSTPRIPYVLYIALLCLLVPTLHYLTSNCKQFHEYSQRVMVTTTDAEMV